MAQEHRCVPNAADAVADRWPALSVTALRPAPLPSAEPVAGATHARVGALAGPGAAPELEVRLHTPIPQVVIVRVSGTVDQCTGATRPCMSAFAAHYDTGALPVPAGTFSTLMFDRADLVAVRHVATVPRSRGPG